MGAMEPQCERENIVKKYLEPPALCKINRLLGKKVILASESGDLPKV